MKNFDKIKNWAEFEELVAAYFRGLDNVKVSTIAVGSDGGTDLFVVFTVNDGISTFERRWIIQCKFYEKAVSPTHLNSHNIPTLIHANNADGYLLICKQQVTTGLTNLFHNLETNCRFKYNYKIWIGSEFMQKVLSRKDLIQQFEI